MQYVDFKEVYRGSKIRFTNKQGKFEGWGKLLRPQTKAITFAPGAAKKMYARQRWMIIWLPVKDFKLNDSDRFTQSNLEGKSTHRTLAFEIGSTKQILYQPSKEEESDGTYPLLDDFGGAF